MESEPDRSMHRMSVHLTDPLIDFIQRRSKARGQKQSEVIREGLLFFMEAVEANAFYSPNGQSRMRLVEEERT